MRLLDTNVLAKWASPKTRPQVAPYLSTHVNEDFVTSSLVVYEFFRPAKRRNNSLQVRHGLTRVLAGIEPFSGSAGRRAAEIEAKLARQNESLGMRDVLIASHTRELGATFVTYDKGDFRNRAVQQLVDVDVIAP